MGVRCAVCTHFADGGPGRVELAEAVVEAAEEPSEFRLLYPSDGSLREKIETIATQVYGADGVDYSPAAARQLDSYERNGFGSLPICIAKTHLSISSDPSLRGAPTGWRLPVREVRGLGGRRLRLPHLRRHAHHARPARRIRRPSASTSTRTATWSACTSPFSMHNKAEATSVTVDDSDDIRTDRSTP